MTKRIFDIIITGDRSLTVRHPRFGETYHSIHGAITESRHVFIEAGMKYFLTTFPETGDLRIFEMGFGTGLNALLTWYEARRLPLHVHYTSIEKFPLVTVDDLAGGLPPAMRDFFAAIHAAPWDRAVEVAPGFRLEKRRGDITEWNWPADGYDVIYYDAFSPRTQPGLWTPALFEAMFEALRPGGVWVTYVAKGQVRRDLQAAGFEVERLPGPPGKREMLRAVKPLKPLNENR